jgi:dihydroorotate dehydrogenase (NAD+) catalytic subunit
MSINTTNNPLEINLGSLKLQNPVLTASGTFGYGQEVADFVDLSRLGAIVCKTVTRHPRAGNPSPRTCEIVGGMMNAIGLQNVGIDRFLIEKLPFLRQCGAPLVVNVAGETIEEFAYLCEILSEQEGISAIELNISCPNVSHGLDFATDPTLTEKVVSYARRSTHLPIFAKLSPNVTDITQIAKAAEAGGADALSVANTFVGLAIDIKSRKPRLANITGGVSGPAIKPIALRAVWRCANVVSVPIIGIGGICTWADAVEFLLAGATAVQIGTATFVQPDAAISVIDGIQNYLAEQNVASVKDLVGAMRC